MEPRYEVQCGLGQRLPCATLRQAVDLIQGNGWVRVVRWNYVPTDDDDDGLTHIERDVLSMPDSPARDVLIALIDGAAAAA
jgi:hypothetical protein